MVMVYPLLDQYSSSSGSTQNVAAPNRTLLHQFLLNLHSPLPHTAWQTAPLQNREIPSADRNPSITETYLQCAYHIRLHWTHIANELPCKSFFPLLHLHKSFVLIHKKIPPVISISDYKRIKKMFLIRHWTNSPTQLLQIGKTDTASQSFPVNRIS